MDDATGDSPTLGSAPPGADRLLAGRYTIRARLGRGAAKEVYLAYDARLDREVALALVVGAAASANARARLQREARVTGRLGDHPNIVTVYDTGELDDVPYLVLRVMSRGSLAAMLENGPPGPAEAVRVARDVAQGLAHAHAHGVVHRDVKPDNIWLAADGTAALGDFGVAYEPGADRLTAEGAVVGTVRYLAPEQIRGEEPAPASDLYALGVTLYELLTGRPPFTGHDAAAVLAQHLGAQPAPPSARAAGVGHALERLVLELMAKAPEARPASAAAVADALAELAPAPAPSRAPAARRLISVVTARADGERDPEALHGTLERCAAIIEHHGGTVERHLGDALSGLFGVREARGDEALRATRAAVGLRAAEAGLRVGADTGEVFVGGATVTGGPIVAAGRLAERAAPGEILLGEALRRAVAGAVRADAATGRLLELRPEQPALLRPPATPFVGRAAERAALHDALARAQDERSCRLVTVIGAPGVGKSRLAGEFVASLGHDATVLAGRCAAYGEGTAYRALEDLVNGLGGDPRARITELLAGDEQAVRSLLGAIGLSGEPVHVEETSWALRRLLERLAAPRPLVVAIEDLHWAQDSLLDLLDQVVTLSGGAPILVLCLARPELLEARAAWAAPRADHTILVLEPLPAGDARVLAEGLGAAGGDAERIAARAEGNPLFVEQLVAVEPGEGELPASIQAVLAARMDRLEPGERTLLQRAAVEGRTFHAGALATLLPDGGRGARSTLVALAHKGLIAADEPRHHGEEAFRFTHALIREAAYAGVPKGLRAELHTALAGWLEARPAAEDEVVGHHLEQACVLAAQLGAVADPALAARAAHRLEGAAHAARARGDPAAATVLLQRAVALVHGDDRSALLPALGAALFEAGRLTEARAVLDAAVRDAPSAAVRARAEVERGFVTLEAEPERGTTEVRRVADAALPTLTGDERGRSRAWSLSAQAAWTAGGVGDADAAWAQAADCAGSAGDERELFSILGWRATAAVLGPTPVDAALRRCAAWRQTVAASPVAVASMVNPMASLHAMRGEQEIAERCLAEANATLDQLGTLGASVSHHEALVRLLGGRPELAEAPLRAGLARLESMEDRALLATTTAMLGQAVLAQGRGEEAAELCRVSEQAAAPDDIITQMLWRSVRARVLADEGRCEEAIALAREAVALMAPTDLLSHHADAMLDLAKVLRTCSGAAESIGTARAALSLYDRKGNVVGARRAQALLEEG